MASSPHTFTIAGVFSAEQFQGNRLAIVAVRANALTQQQKALIAKEFGYTGTVFIHDAPGRNLPRRVEMFTEKGEELAFSGHCLLGTAHYVFQFCEPATNAANDKPATTVLLTKSGPVPVLYNAQRQVAACSIPHAYHLHQNMVAFDKILNVQPQIQIVPTIEKCEKLEIPVVSLLKGMTFALVDLTESPEVLAALEPAKAPEVELDEDWKPSYVGALYYKKRQALLTDGEPTIHSIQARVITNGVEDPGTGSACSALACYLALNEDNRTETKPVTEAGRENKESMVDQVAQQTAKVSLSEKSQRTYRHVYAIQQGVEMGRGCTLAIEVEVEVGGDGTNFIKTVTLSGKASFFGRGELMRL